MKPIGNYVEGGFQILRELARGASSRVYLASDGRVVRALKLFPPDLRARAERELAIGGALRHPHINPVERTVEVAGYPGVLMGYVPGQRLGEWLQQPDADRSRFLTLFAGVLAALSYLQGEGVVHQDIKPENILVDKHGTARLIDFDLARRAGEAPTQRGFAGTVAYLSPEQARGEPATPQSDLYAAGVILYRGLTGQVPFTGSVREVLAAHANAPPPAPSTVDAALWPFDPLFARLLAKDPAVRFADASELSAALKTLEPHR